jgi:hypothetical protein
MKQGPGIALFIAATVFNLVTIAILFFAFLALWGLALAPIFKLPTSSFVILVAFAFAAAGSAFIYRAVAKWYAHRKSDAANQSLTKS